MKEWEVEYIVTRDYDRLQTTGISLLVVICLLRQVHA